MREAKPKIGYIGIGLMGGPMALRLVVAGYEVAVWGRNPEKVQPVVDAEGNIGGLVGLEGKNVVATGHGGRSFDHDPVFGAFFMPLQAELGAGVEHQLLGLELLAAVDDLVIAPRPVNPA